MPDVTARRRAIKHTGIEPYGSGTYGSGTYGRGASAGTVDAPTRSLRVVGLARSRAVAASVRGRTAAARSRPLVVVAVAP